MLAPLIKIISHCLFIIERQKCVENVHLYIQKASSNNNRWRLFNLCEYVLFRLKVDTVFNFTAGKHLLAEVRIFYIGSLAKPVSACIVKSHRTKLVIDS